MALITAKLKFNLHTKNLLQWKINDEDPRVSLIEKSGFGWVRTIQDFYLNTELLTAFYSIFSSESCTFLAGSKKYMISLEDVICLTGLNVDGKAISWKEEKNAREILKKYLGKDPGENCCAGTTVSLKWLLQTFSKLEEDPSEEEVKCSARAYILYALGTFILPDSSGKNVNSLLLSFLEDFNIINSFAWGAAMLAYLIDSLRKRPTSKNNVNLSGNVALLMFWIYERFPQFRPIECLLLESQGTRVIPLIGHWTGLIGSTSKNAHAKSLLDEYEDILQSGNLIYSPISNVVFPASLSFLERQLRLSLAQTYLIYGNHFFCYHPSVCGHQFEDIPSCTSTPELPSAFKLKGKKKERRGPQVNIDWNSELKEVFDRWEERWENLVGDVVVLQGQSSCLGEGQVREEEEPVEEEQVEPPVEEVREEEEPFEEEEEPFEEEEQHTRAEEDDHPCKG